MTQVGLTPEQLELLKVPHQTCQRCGKPTPLGVGLCDEDNPGHIGAPGTAQLHATILGGVIIGFIGLALLGRLALAGVGPFTSQISGVVLQPDGSVAMTVTVRNDGTKTASATCRVSRGGVPAPDDIDFLTDPLQPGQTLSYQRQSLPPGPDGLPYDLTRLAVRCT
ncbi:MAG TPA: hypothetical protein VN771_03365 [Candidatus Baltobacteraceae bacterium]|nr:hypothetical protein [Candidatus Baltobacteraceae bacterium]